MYISFMAKSGSKVRSILSNAVERKAIVKQDYTTKFDDFVLSFSLSRWKACHNLLCVQVWWDAKYYFRVYFLHATYQLFVCFPNILTSWNYTHYIVRKVVTWSCEDVNNASEREVLLSSTGFQDAVVSHSEPGRPVVSWSTVTFSEVSTSRP